MFLIKSNLNFQPLTSLTSWDKLFPRIMTFKKMRNANYFKV